MRSALRVASVAMALVALAGCAAAQRVGGAISSSPSFQATFDSPGDFYDRFDYGYSGLNPWDYADGDAILHFRGDHDIGCQGPDTSRDVAFGGDSQRLDFSQLFWHCAPKGPSSGHVMTGVDTHSYNIAWFSPKPLFTNVAKVCWDINLTEMSRRKWTQVLFVSQADAIRYASDRGTGGFDLGYTSPDFRGEVNDGIFPEGGTLAGVKLQEGAPAWFQNQDTWTTRFEGPENNLTGHGITDKAARYTHCLENLPNNTVRLTQATPFATRTFEMEGQIPQAPVRVVFQDDNYNGPKDDLYDPNVVTWHWDNIQIQAGSVTELASPPPTKLASPPPTELASPLTELSAPPGGDTLTAATVSPVGTAAHAGSAAAALFNIVGLLLIVTAPVLAFVLGPTRFGRRQGPPT